MTAICSVDGCTLTDKLVRGLCDTHYNRMRRRGELELLPVLSPAERLAAGLERKPNGCLEWTGATTGKGYGQIGVDGDVIYTHRLAWGLAHPDEPLPPVVRHFVCDNPPCCDVEHLRPGTHAQNTADMMTKGRGRGNDWDLKTHCTQGHPFDEANTYVDSVGHRNCRACHTAREQIRRAKR
jgi:hypothetical protein